MIVKSTTRNFHIILLCLIVSVVFMIFRSWCSFRIERKPRAPLTESILFAMFSGVGLIAQAMEEPLMESY